MKIPFPRADHGRFCQGFLGEYVENKVGHPDQSAATNKYKRDISRIAVSSYRNTTKMHKYCR